MNKIKYIIIAMVLSIVSCEDYLDTYPGDKYDDATLWRNTNLIEQFVFGIYKGVPYPFQWYLSGTLVDDAVPIQNDGVVDRILNGTMSPEEPAAFRDNWAACMENWWWHRVYSSIRASNLFFEKIENAQNITEEYKQQLIGEVHFLRGYFYYLLMAQYGGVPLTDRVINIGDDYNIPRNTFEETINFIIDDLDAAIANDKLEGQADKTRATTGAVMALKSRVLLYAASELYHNSSSWAGDYEHPELIGYINGDRQELYQKAKEAAEALMDMDYELYDEIPDPALNFQQVFLELETKEQIFITKYDKEKTPYWATDYVAYICGPPSFGGWGLNQITGNLANSFENSNGTPFDFESQKSDPYTNRDPRFYATVLYNGSQWFQRVNGNLQPHNIDINGEDSKDGNTTGYYMKKFISPLENGKYQGLRQPQPFIQIRYAEVLLNYAEACLGLGQEDIARTVLNQIRARAGMPDIPQEETGQALLNKYRNERRVEMAFEVQRFFDVRRWMIAPDSYTDVYGVTYDGSTYEQVVFESHNWNPSHYFVPIKYEETLKNTALIQNPGYN